MNSKYIGETEQNIAHAFARAKREDAVLLFDEVDSFLADRSSAERNWEVAQVNEMLVQMENATTNLMDNIDKASLRRFDIKMEFGFLKPDQSWKLFLTQIKILGLRQESQSYIDEVKGLRGLTPGDFAAVARQHRFRPVQSQEDLIKRLKEEIRIKNLGGGKLGFL